jgi:hypothetical protein
MTTQISEASVNVARRDFLKAGGALVVTFSLGASDASVAAGVLREDGRARSGRGFLAIDAKAT